MDYCRSCGAELAAGTCHCPHCGTSADEYGASAANEPDDDLLREVCELARRDGIISAVKRYREATGCSLKTAKDAVDRLLAGGGDTFQADRPPLEHVEAAVLEVAQAQGKIAAIKRYREAKGCGLKEAKEAVEALLQGQGVQPRTGSGCAGAALLLLAVGLGCWWRL